VEVNGYTIESGTNLRGVNLFPLPQVG